MSLCICFVERVNVVLLNFLGGGMMHASAWDLVYVQRFWA